MQSIFPSLPVSLLRSLPLYFSLSHSFPFLSSSSQFSSIFPTFIPTLFRSFSLLPVLNLSLLHSFPLFILSAFLRSFLLSFPISSFLPTFSLSSFFSSLLNFNSHYVHSSFLSSTPKLRFHDFWSLSLQLIPSSCACSSLVVDTSGCCQTPSLPNPSHRPSHFTPVSHRLGR